MQELQGLIVNDFENKANIVLGKAEIDKDGLGNFVELQDIDNFNIQTNITNIFQNTCAVSFNITLLNTDDRYSFYNTGTSNYDYIKQGRKIRLYLGARLKYMINIENFSGGVFNRSNFNRTSFNRGGTVIGEIQITGGISDFYWSWVYAIVDKVDMRYSEAGEICNISGRDYIAYLSENHLKKLWWGKNKKYDIVADQEHYVMEDDCTGIYRAFLDESGTGKKFREIWLNSEWTYDWDINEFVFLKPNIPDYNGESCLWLYYFTPQKVENVIGDLLAEAGILNLSEKFLWLNNPDLCTLTGEEIERVWFNSGNFYIRALNMLTETVIYRFYINGKGEPCFKPIPRLSDTIKRIDDEEYIIRKTGERLDELYNHFIINGEKREMRRNWLSVMVYSSVYNLTETSGMLRGAVTDDGGNKVIKRGFKWKTGEGAEETWQETGTDLGIGYFTHILTGLIPDTDYKFCSFAEDDKGNKRQSAWVYFITEGEIS